MRLLYVEDNRINALLFEEALKLDGSFELRVVEDAAQALAMAPDWQPQVLVLDSHLPDMTGRQLLAELRKHPTLGATPAFMCSADAQPDDVRAALDAGFRGYWAKPIDIARVLADLRALQAGSA